MPTNCVQKKCMAPPRASTAPPTSWPTCMQPDTAKARSSFVYRFSKLFGPSRRTLRVRAPERPSRVVRKCWCQNTLFDRVCCQLLLNQSAMSEQRVGYIKKRELTHPQYLLNVHASLILPNPGGHASGLLHPSPTATTAQQLAKKQINA